MGLPTGLGKQTLGGYKQNLVHTRSQEKEAVNTTVRALGILKEVTITFISPTIVWLQAKQQGGDAALPISRKLD